MTTTRFEKFLAIAGILAGVMFVLIGFHGDPPSVSASPQARVDWYNHHKAITAIGGFGAGYFAFLMAFFTVGVRKLLRSGEAGESTYSSAALIGGVLVSAAAVIGALISLGSMEAADKHQAAVVTTLAFLNDFGWLPIMVGFGVLYLATGLGGLRTATLPKWLSIVTIVLGVGAVAGPTGVGVYLVTPLWLIVVGALMLRRSGTPSTVTLPSDQRAPAYTG
jgi:hypothetical protein